MPVAKVSTVNATLRSTKRKSRKDVMKKAREAKKLKMDTLDGQEPRQSPSPPASSSLPQLSSASALSASARKLDFFTSALHSQPASSSSSLLEGSTITQLIIFQNLVDCLICPFCFQSALEGSPESSVGLALRLRLSGVSCCKVITSFFTSRKKDKYFEVNRRAVASSLASGSGQAGLSSFCEIMDMPVFHHKTFLRHQKAIHRQFANYTTHLRKEAVDIVRQAYPEQAGQPVVDVDVSYDGSWHTRGHKSMCGIGCVIENRTGLVDHEVLSKFCHKYAIVGDKLKDDSDKYSEFWSSHKEECDRNHEGSSGSMEQAAAVKMWGRSVERNGLRYGTMISGGDSNTIRQLKIADPYEDLEIEKRECVNHVAKRLGTALRKTVENKKKLKVTLGGNGKGKLTQTKMAKMQKYCTRGIRSHNTMDGMKRAIRASFHHCTSTNEEPHHQRLPRGS